jgi:diaminohydroxyphosphoribosylaminopyrimidine deaminase/5-amino-6-(5-phosphoribosylamino)uracil reductase
METEIGLLEDESRHLIEDFVHFHTTNTPFLTLKAAMTLDGKIATASGDSQWITGTKARRYVHTLRAQSGAVLVGIRTLLQDDAKLTARLPRRELPRQPLRIIVDSRLRTPPACQAVRIAEANPLQNPLLLATTESASLEREANLRRAGVEVLRLPQNAEAQVDLCALFQVLAEQQIISVFSEGGGTLNAALLEAGLAQKVLFFIAPKLLGGRDAPTPLEGHGASHMAEAVALERTRGRRFGEDFAIEGYLKQTT